jgi:hypothetical protein
MLLGVIAYALNPYWRQITAGQHHINCLLKPVYLISLERITVLDDYTMTWSI